MYLSKPLNFEVFDNVLAILGNFVFKQQHKESAGHVTQQVSASVAVHLTEAVDCALLHATLAAIHSRNN